MGLKECLESEGKRFRECEGAFIELRTKCTSRGKKLQKIVKNLQKFQKNDKRLTEIVPNGGILDSD
jgi:hypothetical protein